MTRRRSLVSLLIILAGLLGCEEKSAPPMDEAAEREVVAEASRAIRADREAGHAEVESALDESRHDVDELFPTEDEDDER